MKILKRVGIVLLALLLVYIASAFFCRADIHVERATVINADRDSVFHHVNTLPEWKSWSYWDNIDPNMKSTYEGPASGVGSIHRWTSENDSVGHGSLKITQSVPGEFVETELTFGDMPPSLGGWKFADTTGGVKASTYMDIHVPFLFRPMMAIMNMDKTLGDDFAKSLNGLKKRSEK